MSANNSNTARNDSQNSLSDRNGKSDKSDAHKNKKCCPSPAAVSYTHLDVYKRQTYIIICALHIKAKIMENNIRLLQSMTERYII